jgi:hypothetical protein
MDFASDQSPLNGGGNLVDAAADAFFFPLPRPCWDTVLVSMIKLLVSV